VISLANRSRLPHLPSSRFDSFAEWRERSTLRGAYPVIGVTGSRGKTTVVRLLDAIFSAAGLRTAIRTNVSVEILGERQRGEIAPWTRALTSLSSGDLDIAVEELDWLTISSMGLERESYPAIAITNVCANRDACLIQGDAKRAIASLPIVFEAVSSDGIVVLNGDDYDVSREELEHHRAAVFVGLNRESPGLRDHLARGGSAAWLDSGTLLLGNAIQSEDLGNVANLSFALSGKAGFQAHNALTAGAIAASIGIEPAVVRSALGDFDSTTVWMPDSFKVVEIDGISIVIDRPNPSWFLRPVLRTLRDLSPHRIISVVGRLSGVPQSDLAEVGRLIGRASTLVVAHSEQNEPERAAAIKSGAAQNEVPAVIVHTKSEGRALSRALSLAKRGDLVLILADRPAPLVRTILRVAQNGRSGRLQTLQAT
jgi:cyanophycin synthetase